MRRAFFSTSGCLTDIQLNRQRQSVCANTTPSTVARELTSTTSSNNRHHGTHQHPSRCSDRPSQVSLTVLDTPATPLQHNLHPTSRHHTNQQCQPLRSLRLCPRTIHHLTIRQSTTHHRILRRQATVQTRRLRHGAKPRQLQPVLLLLQLRRPLRHAQHLQSLDELSPVLRHCLRHWWYVGHWETGRKRFGCRIRKSVGQPIVHWTVRHCDGEFRPRLLSALIH